MKKHLWIFFLTLGYNFCLNAQINYDEFEKKMRMNTNTENYNWIHKNVFVDYKFGIVNELFVAPEKRYLYAKYNFQWDLVPSDTVTFIDKGIMIAVFNIALEPRINILNNRKFNLFIKSPISFGYSVFYEPKKANIEKRFGYYNVNLPILLGVSSGLNSSFTNTNKKGFSLCAGYQLMLAPLTRGKTEFLPSSNYKPISEPYKQRKSWKMPLVQLDYYFLNKRSNIRGYSLAFCPYGNFYVKLSANVALTKK